MTYARFAMIALAGLGPLNATDARAAFETEVLSAADPDAALPDLHLGVTFDRRMKQARITREWIQDDGGLRQAIDVRELAYSETVQRLLFDLRLGLFRHLEMHVRAPVILEDDSEIGFEPGVEGRSTIFGSPNANDPNFPYRYPITSVPASRRRAGFGDMTFGLSWSPFVEDEDPSWPTVTLRTDVVTPTGKIRDPKDQRALAGADGSGDVGLGTLTFDVSLAVSRRMGGGAPYLDPYMVFGGRFPVATGVQRDRGLEPPFSGRAKIGAEIVLGERERRQKYAVDVGFSFRFIGAGRTYSELSDYLPDFDQTNVLEDPVYEDYADPSNYAEQVDGARCGTLSGVPCGELNRVDQHVELTGSLAVLIQPSPWVRFRLGADAGFTTAHLITGERVGVDTDPSTIGDRMCGAGPCLGRINISNSRGEDERSPYYDPRYDAVGRRLRAEQILALRLFITSYITF